MSLNEALEWIGKAKQTNWKFVEETLLFIISQVFFKIHQDNLKVSFEMLYVESAPNNQGSIGERRNL